MKGFKNLLGFAIVFMVALVSFCNVGFAATIGTQLTTCESGWQRIDDTNSLLSYVGFTGATDTLYYNSTRHTTTAFNDSVSLKFYGTKIRILGATNAPESTNVTITIDGTDYSFSCYSTSLIPQCLLFEKTELPLGVHTIKISNLVSKYFTFDAIDIDDIGYLLNYAQSTKLITTADNTKVDLSWDSVIGATSYYIKRATTTGGPYTTIATTSASIYTDGTVTNDTTYYYIITPVINSKESGNSNEVSVTITQPTNQLKLVLEVNTQKQLSVSDELSDNTEMEWTSSDSTIATVDANGKVKALKSGNTVITCMSEDKSYTESINVLVVDLEYQLAVDLNVGDTCRLTIDDLANTTNVTWSSYDSTIVTVSAKGKVTAISEGLTYVVASDKDGKEIGRIYIRVRK